MSDLKHMLLGIGFIIIIITTMLLIKNVSDTSNINSLSNSYIVGRAKNCENTEVKNLVISIFKEYNEYYRDINKNSITEIALIYPAISSYDKDIDKYYCTGTIVMKSIPSGFKPVLYDYSNEYYRRSRSDDYKKLYKFDTYELNIEYESQISEGETLVRANVYGSNNFSCSYGICDKIPDQHYIDEEKAKIQKQLEIQAKEQRDKHVVLPD